MTTRILKYLLPIAALLLFASCAEDEASGKLEEVYKPTAEEPEKAPYRKVKTRLNATSSVWTSYTAKTVDRIPGFTPDPEAEPKTGIYGGWKVGSYAATGFFRTEKIDSRWWIIDPQGYPFIHKAIAVFDPGQSDRQKAALQSIYGSTSNWAKSESNMIKSYGFNGVGSWSNITEMRKLAEPPVYCIFINPMAKLRSQMIANGEDFSQAGWQGYQHDVAMVFDPRFDAFVEQEISKAAAYKDDKYLLGYFIDNELPWKNDVLDRCLEKYPTDHYNYIAAKAWLDSRKGKPSTIADVTASDRLAFTGFYFETFMKKVSESLKRHDPNHLFLGTKFNQEKEELVNSEIMRVAGQYSDMVTIDHYRSWEPSLPMMNNWVMWSGIPFMIVEFYAKGEDSGLPNKSGAGWNVETQADRGYFYQNFTLELIRSKGCVGWHWFTYMDNDPENLAADPSNRDSNKGIVTWDFKPYVPLLENMKEINNNLFQLTIFYDKQN